MKKVLSLVLAVALSATLASASQTRINSLGVNNWMVEDDDSIIWYNPARISEYENNVWGEIGTAAAPSASWTDFDSDGAVDPGEVTQAANQVNGTTLANEWGGVSYGLNDLSIAAFIGRPYTNGLQNLDVNPNAGDITTVSAAIGTIDGAKNMTALTPVNKFDLAVSKEISDIQFGLNLNMAGKSATDEYTGAELAGASSGTVTLEKKSSEINLTAGAIMTDVGPLAQLDAVLMYGMPKVENTLTEKPDSGVLGNQEYLLETDGASYLGLSLRGIHEMNAETNLIGYFGYSANNYSNKSEDRNDGNVDGDYTDGGDTWLDREKTVKTSNMNLGVSLNSQVSDKTLLVAALGLNSSKSTDEGVEKSSYTTTQEDKQETATTTIPLNLAAEHSLTDSLRCRLGATTDIISKTKTTTTDKDKNLTDGDMEEVTESEVTTDNSSASATITAGIGLDISDDLVLDAMVRQEVAFTGSYIVSGVPESLASQITLMYKF